MPGIKGSVISVKRTMIAMELQPEAIQKISAAIEEA